MLYVNHFDNFNIMYPARSFIQQKFIGYKIIYQTNQVNEIFCGDKKALKNEMTKLLKEFKGQNKTINVMGYKGGYEVGKKYTISI